MNKSESKYFNTAVKMDEALIELLGKKDFEYITVSEICAKAGVNRSTFYLHYENTRDLLNETIKYLTENFRSCFPDDANRITSRFADCELTELNYINAEYLMPFLQYIKENRRVFATALSNTSTFDTELIFERMFENIFKPILNRFNYPAENQEYVIRFYLNGVMAVVALWLKDGCEKSVEEVAGIIRVCIFGAENQKAKKELGLL